LKFYDTPVLKLYNVPLAVDIQKLPFFIWASVPITGMI